jgi:MarR family transcriptional regulator, organic hydroperoxide resistance regulator
MGVIDMETAAEFRLPKQRSDVAVPSQGTKDKSALTLALATSQCLRALIGLKVAPLGLATGQDRLLLVLDEYGRLNVSSLADTLNVRPSTVSKMMDRLAARGLTQRSGDDRDARRIIVELTDDGRKISRELRELCEAIETELHSDLSEEKSRCMIEGLTLLNEAVWKRLHRLR